MMTRIGCLIWLFSLESVVGQVGVACLVGRAILPPHAQVCGGFMRSTLRGGGIVKAGHLPASVMLWTSQVHEHIGLPYLGSGRSWADLQTVAKVGPLCCQHDQRILEKVVAVAQQ